MDCDFMDCDFMDRDFIDSANSRRSRKGGYIVPICGWSLLVIGFAILIQNGGSPQENADQDKSSRSLPKRIKQKETETVVRARRPSFSRRDWDGVFFENLFAEALEGQRPTELAASGSSEAKEPGDAGDSRPEAVTGNWSDLVQREVLEDQVKRMNRSLNQVVTAQQKFSSEFSDAQLTFGMLSMLFAVINQYEEHVRWKEDSLDAQAAFQRAASFTSNQLMEAFKFSQKRKQALTDLIRGSRFPEEAGAAEEIDWSKVVDRRALMQWLDDSLYTKLRGWTRNQDEFTQNLGEFSHEVQLVAMMGNVLAQEGMDDAENEEYIEHAMRMIRVANDATAAAENKDFEAASEAINLLEQSCNRCHDEWR